MKMGRDYEAVGRARESEGEAADQTDLGLARLLDCT